METAIVYLVKYVLKEPVSLAVARIQIVKQMKYAYTTSADVAVVSHLICPVVLTSMNAKIHPVIQVLSVSMIQGHTDVCVLWEL
jgi:uncharacterized membrane protein YvlD (DUF360 family)